MWNTLIFIWVKQCMKDQESFNQRMNPQCLCVLGCDGCECKSLSLNTVSWLSFLWAKWQKAFLWCMWIPTVTRNHFLPNFLSLVEYVLYYKRALIGQQTGEGALKTKSIFNSPVEGWFDWLCHSVYFDFSWRACLVENLSVLLEDDFQITCTCVSRSVTLIRSQNVILRNARRLQCHQIKENLSWNQQLFLFSLLRSRKDHSRGLVENVGGNWYHGNKKSSESVRSKQETISRLTSADYITTLSNV